MVVFLVVLVGAVCGAVLGEVAFRLEPSDDQGDWRGTGLRTRVGVEAALAVVSASAAAWAWSLAPSAPMGVVLGAFAAASPGLAVIDIASRRLPFAALGAVAAVALSGLAFTPHLGPSALTAALVAGLLIGLALLVPGGVGGGDIAAAAVAALTLTWAGWLVAVLALALGFLLMGAAGLVARVTVGEVLLPLGPFLVAGWWSALLHFT